jgi:predicted AAA+ superfamily ATPase
LVNRDIAQLSDIDKAHQLRALIHLVASRSGGLLVPGNLAKDLTITAPTVSSYLGLLEEVFLVKRIPAWSRNLGTRVTAMPKVAFVDSGIAASLIGEDERSLGRIGSALGGLLEGFVAMELSRGATWSEQRVQICHYRTRDKVEVDIVLENQRRQVIGIEVKAGMTVRSDDFHGLRHLSERLGDDFIAGFVLYLGDQTLPFGAKLRALPVSALWHLGI